MTWPIVGHDWAVTLLRKGLDSGRVSHAYLFSGPPQVGKTTLALLFARALNCREPDAPCGHCTSCTRIGKGTHPDVRQVANPVAGDSIKIDQIREMQREAALAPYEGRYRVFILRGMDFATPEAANSLLKTLEEPPAHVVLLLTVVHPETLPATVLSRCQRLDLRPVPSQLLDRSLRERGLPAEQARLLARLSGGRVGWALAAGQDPGFLKQREMDLDRFVALLSAGQAERIQFAARTTREAAAARQQEAVRRQEVIRRQIELWTTWWRDLLFVCSQAEDHVVNLDRGDELRRLANGTTVLHAWPLLRDFRRAADQLDANVNAQLVLEALLLMLPRWSDAGSAQQAQPLHN